MPTESELNHLRRCVELAAKALEEGNEPFGSVLVASDGAVLVEDHNRVGTGDPTRHPELELARWARAAQLTVEDVAGLAYDPFQNSARQSTDVSVNYMMHLRRHVDVGGESE